MIEVSRQEQITIRVTVNGKQYEESVYGRKLLCDFLREDCGLTGTHVGCEHGVCGACTVLLNGRAVRSCLMFAVQADGQKIETVEGMAQSETGRDLQKSFSQHHALQCGFCTSGILASAMELVKSGTDVSTLQIEEMLTGHLCRCTGYKPIVEAIEDVAAKRKEVCK